MLEDIRERINRYLIHETDFLKVKDTMNEDQLRQFVDTAITDVCQHHKIILPLEQRVAIIKTIVGGVVSLGPLRSLMEDPSITEIMVNRADQIFIQRNGKIVESDVRFADNQQLMHTVQKILVGSGANKRLDESSPFVDFSLSDGSRVNVIIPPCSVKGAVMTIRKFKADIATVEDLLKLKMIDKQIATLLMAAMKAKLNVIFCGSTGSGKTTMLNVFSRHIPEEERVVTIEDTAELRLLQKHVVSLVSKPSNIEGKGEITMADLFINSLRMRPDRIIIGEIRGKEMLDLIQSISSGHSGSLAIVHAESPEDCFNRMVTMMLMTGIRLSTEEIQRQVAKAIDLVVHIELYMDGRRRVSYVSDLIHDPQTNKVKIENIFEFKQKGISDQGDVIGEWVMHKKKPSFYHKFEKRRVALPEGFFEK